MLVTPPRPANRSFNKAKDPLFTWSVSACIFILLNGFTIPGQWVGKWGLQALHA